MTARKKSGTNGVVDHSKWSLEQFGTAADALIVEAAARRERETREATMQHLVAGDYGAALSTFGAGLMYAADLDDGQPRDYRQTLADATAKTIAMGGQGR